MCGEKTLRKIEHTVGRIANPSCTAAGPWAYFLRGRHDLALLDRRTLLRASSGSSRTWPVARCAGSSIRELAKLPNTTHVTLMERMPVSRVRGGNSLSRLNRVDSQK